MYMTSIKSCLAITVLVTLLYVIAMSIFDTSVASHFEDGMGMLSLPTHETEDQYLTRLLHALTTVMLVGPVTLVATLMFRQSNISSKELQNLVNRDRLTDVATRDFFFERLSETPNGYGVSLMVDIDHFKKVNDTYGHLAGDTVIQQVARVLRVTVRPDDIVCRFGGEEFVIFLQNATPQEGWQISERIREGIEAAGTPSDRGVIKVTVSVGGSLKDRMEDVEAAIARADACLYRAKASGRNRTVVDWRNEETAGVAA